MSHTVYEYSPTAVRTKAFHSDAGTKEYIYFSEY